MLGITLLLIVSAILYFGKPSWLAGFIPGILPDDPEAGVADNPVGDLVGLEVGKAAPDFALRTLDGTLVRLSDFRGSKHVIVNFWASWCGPCKLEMPDLEAISQQHQEQLVVLGVNLQESAQDVERFLAQEVHVSYPILMDAQGEVAAAYNKFAQPTSFFIDKQGAIHSVKYGAYTTEELQQRVQELLADR